MKKLVISVACLLAVASGGLFVYPASAQTVTEEYYVVQDVKTASVAIARQPPIQD